MLASTCVYQRGRLLMCHGPRQQHSVQLLHANGEACFLSLELKTNVLSATGVRSTCEKVVPGELLLLKTH